MYGRKWRKARERHLSGEPWCRECLKDGIYTPANEVDHITPHRGDTSLFWNEDNWQSLCKSHHSSKTAEEVGLNPIPPSKKL